MVKVQIHRGVGFSHFCRPAPTGAGAWRILVE